MLPLRRRWWCLVSGKPGGRLATRPKCTAPLWLTHAQRHTRPPAIGPRLDAPIRYWPAGEQASGRAAGRLAGWLAGWLARLVGPMLVRSPVRKREDQIGSQVATTPLLRRDTRAACSTSLPSNQTGVSVEVSLLSDKLAPRLPRLAPATWAELARTEPASQLERRAATKQASALQSELK